MGETTATPEHGGANAEVTRGDGSGDGQAPFRYDARLANEIELRWQDRWEAAGTFNTPNPQGPLAEGFGEVADRPKSFVMDMFPYPSGAGLHVGHPLGYIATDVYARYLRMTGHNVLHPFGFDAFGLPAEQYAIDTGQHPAVTTRNNIANMRRQLRRLGLGHDRRREFATTDPAYYRWTQWIFLKFFNSWYDDRSGRARPIEDLIAEFESGEPQPPTAPESGGTTSPAAAPQSSAATGPGTVASQAAEPVAPGTAHRPWAELTEVERRAIVDSYRLAYVSQELVNWCPGLGTVLANEEITADGRSDIGNYPVYRRPLRQWKLRITAYAERLIEDLDHVDWPESIKLMQRNWIGRSDGANIDFRVTGPRDTAVRVFTTRPDTLPGATYMVLAPEHPLAGALAAESWPEGTPNAWTYPEGRDRPASEWTPAAAVRAYREAAANLSDRQRTAGHKTAGEQTTGGKPVGQETAARESEAAEGDYGAKSGVFTGSYVTNPMTGEPMPVFLADYVLMGYGTGAIMAVPAHDQRDLEFARQFHLPVRAVLQPPAAWLEQHDLPADAPAAQWPAAFPGDGRYLDFAIPGLDRSGPDSQAGIAATVRWLEQRSAGRRARTYRLRDWLFARQRYWGEPFPIVYDEHGLPVALPEEMLPVRLPEMTDFRPLPHQDESAEPVPPLARLPEWINVDLDLGGGTRRYRREASTMPQWAGSCWYYLRYLDPAEHDRLVSPGVERYWMVPPGASQGDGGVDLYVGGVEHAVLHLLYARFWHKLLYDLGYVSTREPFNRLFNQGYILADAFTDARGMYVPAAEVTAAGGRFLYHGAQVERRAGKMGKSLKNSVSPDEIYATYGADTLRLYEMAMGPLDVDRSWRTDDMAGVYRFLQRLWRNIVDEQTGQATVADRPLDEVTARRLHRTIMIVRQDFDELRFNTAIARLIELNTHASRLASAQADHAIPRLLAEPLVLMVAPLAPHIAEELWSLMGHPRSLAYERFPEFDPALAAARSVVIPIQVNGKARFRIEAPADASEEEIRRLLIQHADYARYTDGVHVERIVIVPGRIANIVTH